MHTFQVNLRSVNDVKAFVAAASMTDCDIDVLSGRYLVDAKSIMGLFSLNLTKPVTVQVHGSREEMEAFQAEILSLLYVPQS